MLVGAVGDLLGIALFTRGFVGVFLFIVTLVHLI